MVKEVYEGTKAEEHALLSAILIFSGINERKIQRVWLKSSFIVAGDFLCMFQFHTAKGH